MPRSALKGGTQNADGSAGSSFEDLLKRANIRHFRFHDLRHTFASRYVMNGGDLYELAKIPDRSKIKMTERYAKLGRTHFMKTGTIAKVLRTLLKGKPELVQVHGAGDQRRLA